MTTMSSASRDPLTELPRRSSFLLALELAAAECYETNRRMALIIAMVRVCEGCSETQNRLSSIRRAAAKALRLVASRDASVGDLGDGRFGAMTVGRELSAVLRLARDMRTAMGLHFEKPGVSTTVGVAVSPVLNRWTSDDLLDLAEWRLTHCAVSERAVVRGDGHDPKLVRFAFWPSFSEYRFNNF